MHRDHLVGNRYFVPFFVFYTKSVMLGLRFIPESIFYTQSVKCLVPVLHLSARVFCFVLYLPSHAVSDMFFLYLIYLSACFHERCLPRFCFYFTEVKFLVV